MFDFLAPGQPVAVNPKDLVVSGSEKHDAAMASTSKTQVEVEAEEVVPEGVMVVKDPAVVAEDSPLPEDLADLGLSEDEPGHDKKRRRLDTLRQREQRQVETQRHVDAQRDRDAELFVPRADADAFLHSLPNVPHGLEHMFGFGTPTLSQFMAFNNHLLMLVASSGPSQSQVSGLNLEVRNLKEKVVEVEEERESLKRERSEVAKRLKKLEGSVKTLKAEKEGQAAVIKKLEAEMKEAADRHASVLAKRDDEHMFAISKMKEWFEGEKVAARQAAVDEYVQSHRLAARAEYFQEYLFFLLDIKYRRALLEAGSTYEMDYKDFAGFPENPAPYVPAKLGAYVEDKEGTLESFHPAMLNSGKAVPDWEGKLPTGADELKKALMEAYTKLQELKAERLRVAAAVTNPAGRAEGLEFEQALIETSDLVKRTPPPVTVAEDPKPVKPKAKTPAADSPSKVAAKAKKDAEPKKDAIPSTKSKRGGLGRGGPMTRGGH